MSPPAAPTLAEELAAAIGWWREAGVDRAFRDDAEGWLAPPPEPERPNKPARAEARPAQPRREVPTAPRIGGDPAGWPQALSEVAEWWLTEPTLDEGGIAPRVPPRGPAGAELMVVVPMPEPSDAERLLSDAEGKFLSAILQACGLAEEQVYFASALPRHTAVPDAEQLRAGGLGAVLEHHVRLAAPKRVLAFGRLVPPLLGHDMAQASAAIPFFNHEVLRVPVMAAGGLDRLLRSAAARETFWRRWLEWTSGTR